MKVLLVNPPTFNHIRYVLPEAVEEERGFNPPLGLMYLGGYLQKYAPEIEIKLIDCLAEQINYKDFKKLVKEFSPDVVGITVMSFTLIDALEVAKIAKQLNPQSIVVFGGPHVNIYGKKTLDLGNVDFIVLGEGEKIFYDLINNLKDEDKLKKIAGLIFYDKGGNLIHTGLPGLIPNLDEIPSPARNLIDNTKYSSVLGTSKLVTTMMTSRGCPYKCLFCDRPQLGKIFRAISPDKVIVEIKDAMQYGIREFLMYDDTFTVNRQRTMDICNKIIKEKLNIQWDIRARVNTVDEEMLKKLKKAGCIRVHYGVESGTQKILDILRKGITLEEVEKTFKLTRKLGIETLAYFMIGNPGETKEDIKQTIKFARKIKPDYVHITITTPFPATDMYRLALEKKIIKKDVWLDFASNPTSNFTPPLWEEFVNAKKLHQFVKKAYRQFYFRPSYLFKRIITIKTFDELKIKTKAGLKMLKI